MRITAFIMAMLIIVLSCLPCADVDAMPLSSAPTEVSNAPQEQHSEHQGKDLCSPLCHCSCCSTFSVVNISLQIPVLVRQQARIAYNACVTDTVIEISLPIWQPPRLV